MPSHEGELRPLRIQTCLRKTCSLHETTFPVRMPSSMTKKCKQGYALNMVRLSQWSLTDLPSFSPVTYCARPFRTTTLNSRLFDCISERVDFNRTPGDIYTSKTQNHTCFAWSAATMHTAQSKQTLWPFFAVFPKLQLNQRQKINTLKVYYVKSKVGAAVLTFSFAKFAPLVVRFER